MRPRVYDGPGYLLACVVDAIVEQFSATALKTRELATIWGTMLFPMLTPSVRIPSGVAPMASAGDHLDEPEYLQSLPFFFLHPRLQRLIVIIDQLATAIESHDQDYLRGFIERLQANETLAVRRSEGLEAELEDVLCVWMNRLISLPLRRNAGGRWNSGFGYRMCREILDAVRSESGAFAKAHQWDRQVNGDFCVVIDGELPQGHLNHRLRRALSTSLCFPGRPPHPDGPAVDQLVDRVWSRWTNTTFLL